MMVRGAEKAVTIVTTAQGLNRKMEALMPSFEKAKKKGVKIRIATKVTKDNLKIAKELGKVAEVKNMENIKARFAVIDGKQLLFMVMDDDKVHPTYDLGIWVNSDFFAQALEQMFEPTWQKLTKPSI